MPPFQPIFRRPVRPLLPSGQGDKRRPRPVQPVVGQPPVSAPLPIGTGTQAPSIQKLVANFGKGATLQDIFAEVRSLSAPSRVANPSEGRIGPPIMRTSPPKMPTPFKHRPRVGGPNAGSIAPKRPADVKRKRRRFRPTRVRAQSDRFRIAADRRKARGASPNSPIELRKQANQLRTSGSIF